MLSTRFVVEGKPLPQPRGKIVTIKLRNGQVRSSVVVPDKHPIHDWKFAVVDGWRFERVKIDGPIAAVIDIVASRPDTLRWVRKPMPRLRDTRHVGDADNYAKAILDALNGKAYDDDAQICELLVRRWIASGAEDPHAVVELRELDTADATPQLTLFD